MGLTAFVSGDPKIQPVRNAMSSNLGTFLADLIGAGNFRAARVLIPASVVCRPDHFADSWLGSGQTHLLTSLEIGRGAGGHKMSKFHMPIERLEKRASEKEPVARPSSNKDVRLGNQRHAELLLRRRIQELDQRLALLKSEREKSSGLWKSRKPGFVAWTTPALWQRLSR
jgi:hypothetical protein